MKKIMKNKKFEILFLLLIIILAAFLRFYQINRFHFFNYDQARDALFIKRIIVDHQFRLIGTQTSIPGFYTGPAYYYLMAPFLWLFRLNPVGIDVGIAIIGFLTVIIFYWLLLRFTQDKVVSLAFTALYATQPQIVQQSRYAWNPNPTPFFFLLYLWGLFKIANKKRFGWLLTFISLAFLLQLHYSAFSLLLVLILFVIFFRKQIKFGRPFYLSFLSFLILMSPLLLFDFRHNFINLKALFGYFKNGAPGEISLPSFFSGSIMKLKLLLIELPLGIKSSIIAFLILAVLFLLFFFKNYFRKNLNFILVSLSLFVGILVAALYRGPFYNFYLTFLYPVGFLWWGILISKLKFKRWPKNLVLILLVLIIIFFNLKNTTIFSPPKRTMADIRKVADVISQDVNSTKPFNLVGIQGGDRFDYNAVDYRYFLETFYHQRALDWDIASYQKAENLYLISTVGKIEPLTINVWELNLFGPRKVLETWELENNVLIYKLGK